MNSMRLEHPCHLQHPCLPRHHRHPRIAHSGSPPKKRRRGCMKKLMQKLLECKVQLHVNRLQLTRLQYVHAIDLRLQTPRQRTSGDVTLGADLNPWNFVSTSEILSVGGTVLSRSSHSILVVLANKDTRKIPQFCLNQTQY
jgi:hypothetical protein